MKKILITLMILLMMLPSVYADIDLNTLINSSNDTDTIILENDNYSASKIIIDKNLTITSNENSVINGNSNQIFIITKGNSLTSPSAVGIGNLNVKSFTQQPSLRFSG